MFSLFSCHIVMNIHMNDLDENLCIHGKIELLLSDQISFQLIILCLGTLIFILEDPHV